MTQRDEYAIIPRVLLDNLSSAWAGDVSPKAVSHKAVDEAIQAIFDAESTPVPTDKLTELIRSFVATANLALVTHEQNLRERGP